MDLFCGFFLSPFFYTDFFFCQVIVIDATFPTPFDSETLYGHDKALEEDLTYWIAAQLEPARLKAGEAAQNRVANKAFYYSRNKHLCIPP
jgi:hypothetical protein